MPDKRTIKVLDGYDRKDQAARVCDMVLPGETLYLVFDCKGRGSGFVGITDKRVIARDDGRRGREKQITSIPFARIHSVSLESDKGWVRGSSFLSISAGDDDWGFNFKGTDKAKRAYERIMEHLLDLPRSSASDPTDAEAEG